MKVRVVNYCPDCGSIRLKLEYREERESTTMVLGMCEECKTPFNVLFYEERPDKKPM